MSARTHDEAIDVALARFNDGDRKAAWDLLAARARRYPDVIAYRESLSALHRRAGHPDQAARWGAHDLASLDRRELRALRRSVVQFRTEADVRRYLVLDGELPPEVTAHLGSPAAQRVAGRARVAQSLDAAAGILLALLGGGSFAMGSIVVLVLAFTGARDTQQAAQVFTFVALLIIAGCAAIELVATLLREQWVRSGLLAGVVIASMIALALSDPTAPLPFG